VFTNCYSQQEEQNLWQIRKTPRSQVLAPQESRKEEEEHTHRHTLKAHVVEERTRARSAYCKIQKNQRTAFYVLVLKCRNAPLNFNQIWCSQTRTVYISLDRPRSATLLKCLCHLGTTKYQMMTRYRHNTLESQSSWHFGSKYKHLASQILSCVVWHPRDCWYICCPRPCTGRTSTRQPKELIPGVEVHMVECRPASQNPLRIRDFQLCVCFSYSRRSLVFFHFLLQRGIFWGKKSHFLLLVENMPAHQPW